MPILFTIPIMIFFIIAFILLLINAINPRFAWKTFESWKATSEPTDAYFMSRRITSIIGLIIISIIMLGPTIMYMLNK